MPEVLHLATAIDETYLVPLKVTLETMTERLRPSLRPVLFIVNRNLTDSQLRSINSLVEAHSIVPSEESLSRIPRHPEFPPEAAFPLLLADVLPGSVKRVLFLDPDLLVLDDVGKIWETDLAGNCVAAVVDQAIPFASSPRGLNGDSAAEIPHDAPYFNAGVLLIDLERWRSDDIAAQALTYLQRYADTSYFFHQEALNAVLVGKWLQLDSRWNLIASLTARRYAPRHSREIESPGIVHFAGKFKPWRIRVGGPFASAYYDALARLGENVPSAGITETLLGIYDRHLRDYLYPTEQLLWKRRLI
jgi:lipopolysaccharide biosynthesis glycosyltransferase